jgi:glycolate oxidase FAD binding subunit
VAVAPDSFTGFAAALAGAAAEGRTVRIAGAGTKGRWGAPPRHDGQVLLSTARLNEIHAHNRTEAIAVVGAGVTLDHLQAELAGAGQMLALDPPFSEAATIGGIFATGDSGPLRHRFGTPRDQILAVTVALSDGSVARSGAMTLANVAGYDLGRLFCGSFGTLGVILSVTVRLTARPDSFTTAVGLADDAVTLASAAAAVRAAPLELDSLDIAWHGGRGGLLARASGPDAPPRAERAGALMTAAGLTGVELTAQDTGLWARQRAGQRSPRRALVRIGARASQLPLVLVLADLCQATVVGRSGAGISYLELEGIHVDALRRGLSPGMHAELLDRPAPGHGGEIGDFRAAPEGPTAHLMAAVKARFDPGDVCNPGLSVGGI